MTFDQINYLSVLVASIVSFVFGMLWYSPILFGKIWMKLNKTSMKDLEKGKKGMGMKMILGFIGTLITASVIDLLINMTNSTGISQAINLSFMIWFGFLATTTLLGSVIWDNKPWGLFLLNGAYWLINLEIIGIILVLM